MENAIHIVGARPNFMKAAPVVAASRKLGDDPVLIHTGQHYDAAMSDIFFEQLNLPRPDRNLDVGSGSHAAQTAALMVALEETFMNTILLVSSCTATSIRPWLRRSCARNSGSLSPTSRQDYARSIGAMPEEINRVVTDALSDLHFVTSPEAMAHLADEGIPASKMHFVGNPMIDTLLRFRNVLKVESQEGPCTDRQVRRGDPSSAVERRRSGDGGARLSRLFTGLQSECHSYSLCIPAGLKSWAKRG